MSEEWGPWIEHDGKGCPVPDGAFVLVDVGVGALIIGHGRFCEFCVRTANRDWIAWPHVIRYRIRKPRGLTILEELIADLPQPATEKETA